MLITQLSLVSLAVVASDEWDVVRWAIDAARIPLGVHVLVGDASNSSLFTHQKGLVQWETPMSIFSASKWISGVAMMKEVLSGRLKLDDYAHEHLDYWTKDPADSRSAVTLRHLLGFTSGFSGSNSCSSSRTYSDCVRGLYDSVPHKHAAGTVFEYNEVHINLAAGMVTAATGKTVFDLIKDEVFVPLGMTETEFMSNTTPNLGAAFRSTARDYAKFLRAYFLGLNKAAGGIGVDAEEMEKDQFPEASRSAYDDGWHYGLCNWYDCTLTNDWSNECKEARVHSSAGALGFRPVVDRRLGYYFQIASNSGSGASMDLYHAIKPLMDQIMEARRHKLQNATSF